MVLVESMEVDYEPGATTATLTVYVRPNSWGVASITVTVKDDGGKANGGMDENKEPFTLTVTPEQSGVVTHIGDNIYEVNMRMFPNPTEGPVNIELSNNRDPEVVVSVFNVTGDQVLRREYTGGEGIRFDLSQYVSGMYFVNVQVDGRRMVEKLILKRQK